jgi:hypothetical protein
MRTVSNLLSAALAVSLLTPALTLAQTKALAFVNGIVTRQAMMLSFEQLFLLFGSAFVLSLPLLLLMHRSRGGPGGGEAAAH